MKLTKRNAEQSSSEVSEKVRPLLCYLQNTGQYDSDVDSVNMKLYDLLSEVTSLTDMRSAVEEIYRKVILVFFSPAYMKSRLGIDKSCVTRYVRND